VQVPPSTLLCILQRLEGGGLFVRERDPGDNRRVRLRLKARARTFTRASQGGTVEQAVTRALGRTPARHVRAAREVLSAVAVALNDVSEPVSKAESTRGARRAGNEGSPAASVGVARPFEEARLRSDRLASLMTG
jgi:hypothetical protein